MFGYTELGGMSAQPEVHTLVAITHARLYSAGGCTLEYKPRWGCNCPGPGTLVEEGPMLHVRCGYEAVSSFQEQSNDALCVPLHVSLLTRYLEGRGA